MLMRQKKTNCSRTINFNHTILIKITVQHSVLIQSTPLKNEITSMHFIECISRHMNQKAILRSSEPKFQGSKWGRLLSFHLECKYQGMLVQNVKIYRGSEMKGAWDLLYIFAKRLISEFCHNSSICSSHGHHVCLFRIHFSRRKIS